MNKLQIYKKELDRIRNIKGNLTAKTVIDEARDKKSPLHDYFDWDDNIAGDKWRLQQARVLIKIVYYEIIKVEGKPVRLSGIDIIKLDNNEDYDEKKAYFVREDIMKNKVWRTQLIITAINQITYWRTKYELYSIPEFKPIIKEIRKLERRFKKDDGKRKTKNCDIAPQKKRN